MTFLLNLITYDTGRRFHVYDRITGRPVSTGFKSRRDARRLADRLETKTGKLHGVESRRA